jgi:hypothetical protein
MVSRGVSVSAATTSAAAADDDEDAPPSSGARRLAPDSRSPAICAAALHTQRERRGD